MNRIATAFLAFAATSISVSDGYAEDAFDGKSNRFRQPRARAFGQLDSLSRIKVDSLLRAFPSLPEVSVGSTPYTMRKVEPAYEGIGVGGGVTLLLAKPIDPAKLEPAPRRRFKGRGLWIPNADGSSGYLQISDEGITGEANVSIGSE